MDTLATRELARIQSVLHVLKLQRDTFSELSDISALRGLEESCREDLQEAQRRGLVSRDPLAVVREDWCRLASWSNRIQLALKAADKLGRQLESMGSGSDEKSGKKQKQVDAGWTPTLAELHRLRTALEVAPKALADALEQGRGELRSEDWSNGLPYPELSEIAEAMEWTETLELAESPKRGAQGIGHRDRPLVASRLAVESGSPMVERRQKSLKDRLAHVLNLIEQHAQHVATLEEVGRLTEVGQVDSARQMMTTVQASFGDLDYGAKEQELLKIENQFKAREERIAEATACLHAIGLESSVFFVAPPLDLRRRAGAMVTRAETVLAEMSAEAMRWPKGSELERSLTSGAVGLTSEVASFKKGPMNRIRLWILGTSLTWLVVLGTGVPMFQQHLVRQERERQRLAAEARAAEERALAEAKAKGEAARLRLAGGGRFDAGEALVPGIPVRWIPAGRFRIGSSSDEEGRFSDEIPHDVVLSRGFFLAETECTQGQWKAVMQGNPSYFKGVDRPVEQVSWEEAVEFCWKLTAQQRAGGILPEGWEWRLPTEAEWEYAARAGTPGARNGELNTIAWDKDNSGGQTHPVKQKAANAWGLYDMLGNVWEWCADWHGKYPTGSVTDPRGPGSGSTRVRRGGSWEFVSEDAPLASRDRHYPGSRLNSTGFRPALGSVR